MMKNWLVVQWLCYFCLFVSGQENSQSYSYNVDIVVSPTKLQYNKPFSLLCEMRPSGKFKYQWFRNDVPISTEEKISFNQLTKELEGMYRCKVMIAMGNQNMELDAYTTIHAQQGFDARASPSSIEIMNDESLKIGGNIRRKVSGVVFERGSTVNSFTYKWTNKNNEIVSTMNILNIPIKDNSVGGTYQCQIKSKITGKIYDVTTDVNILEEKKESFSYNVDIIVSPTSLRYSKPFSLKCNMKPWGMFKYQWFRNNVPISTQETISFNSLTKELEGIYKCKVVVSTRGGDMILEAFTTVHRGGSFEEASVSIPNEILKGESLRIGGRIRRKVSLINMEPGSTVNTFTYRWLNENNQIVSISDILDIPINDNLVGRTYECIATSKITGKIYKTKIIIDLQEKTQGSYNYQVEIMVKPGSVKYSEPFSLQCNVKPFGRYRYQWFRNDVPISLMETISFDSLTKEIEGMYKCKATISTSGGDRTLVAFTTIYAGQSYAAPSTTLEILPGESLRIGGRIKRKVSVTDFEPGTTVENFTFKWIHENNQIVSTNNILDIQIQNASLSGRYDCISTSKITGKVYKTTIMVDLQNTVQEFDRFYLDIVVNPSKLMYAQPFSLKCNVRPLGNYRYMWYKNNNFINANETIWFNSLTKDAEGLYKCKVFIDIGAEAEAFVTIKTGQNYPDSLQTFEILNGESLKIGGRIRRKVFVIGFEPGATSDNFTFKWINQNNQIISTSDILDIPIKDNSDIGTYECIVTSKTTQRVYNVKLYVSLQGVIRESVGHNIDIIVSPDLLAYFKPFSLRCNITPNGIYRYQWFRNGIPISTNETISYTSLKKSLEGTYKCQTFISLSSGNVTLDAFTTIYANQKDTVSSISIESLPGESLAIGGRIKRKASIKGTKFGDKFTYKWINDGNKTVSTIDILDIPIYDSSLVRTYECLITSTLTGKVYKTKIVVHIQDRKISFNYNVDIIVKPDTLRYFEPFSLKCKMTPNGNYSYKWYKDDKPISTIEIIFFNSLTKDLEGMYKCKATVSTVNGDVNLIAFNTIYANQKYTKPSLSTKSLRDESLRIGGKIHRKASVIGLEPGAIADTFTYKWFNEKNEIISYTDVLNIPIKDNSVGGNYKCIYTSRISGKVYKTWSIVDMKRPTRGPYSYNVEITVKPVSLRYSEPFSLKCNVTPSGDYEYEWYKNYVSISTNETISFTSLTKELEGMYKCKATIKHASGTNTLSAFTTIYANQRYISPTISIEILLHESLKIGGNIRRKATIKGLEAGARADTFTYKWINENNQTVSNSDILDIPIKDNSVEGVYECQYISKITGKVYKAKTMVNLQRDTSVSYSYNVDIKVKPGKLKYSKPFSLRCNVVPSGRYKYQWLRNDIPISTYETVTFSSLTKELEGMYKCKATITIGGNDMTLVAFTTIYANQRYADTNTSTSIAAFDDESLELGGRIRRKMSVEDLEPNATPDKFTFKWINEFNQTVSTTDILDVPIKDYSVGRTYKCISRSKITGKKYHSTITIDIKGYAGGYQRYNVDIIIDPTTLKYSEPFTLRCNVTPADKYDFQWFRNDKPIETKEVISFNSLTKELEGMYKCKVTKSSSSGNMTLVAFTTVYANQKYAVPSISIETIRGESLKIGGQIRRRAYIAGVEPSSTNDKFLFKWTNHKNQTVSASDILDIPITDYSMGGIYECQYTSKVTGMVFKTMILVEIQKDATRSYNYRLDILVSPDTLKYTETVILRCNMKPSGTYGYQWFRNDIPLSTNETVTLKSLAKNDEGIYKCEGTIRQDSGNMTLAAFTTIFVNQRYFIPPISIEALLGESLKIGGKIQRKAVGFKTGLTNDSFTYKWINNKNQTVSTSEILEIPIKDNSVGGFYECQYTSKNTGRVYRTNIMVDLQESIKKQYNLKIDISVNPLLLKYLEPFSLKCTVAPIGKYKYQWYRNDIPISTNDTISYNSLIKNLEGMYKCMATITKDGTEINLNSFVTVYSSQRYEVPMAKIESLSGESLKIGGKIYRRASFATLKKGSVIDTFLYKWVNEKNQIVSNSDTLELPIKDKSVGGTYYCQYTSAITGKVHKTETVIDVSGDMTGSYSYNVNIIVNPSSLQFSKPFSLKCNMMPSGSYKYQWFRDDIPISTNETISYESLTKDLQGTYRCKATVTTSGGDITLQAYTTVYGGQGNTYSSASIETLSDESLRIGGKIRRKVSVSNFEPGATDDTFTFKWTNERNEIVSTSNTLDIQIKDNSVGGTYKCISASRVTGKVYVTETKVEIQKETKGSYNYNVNIIVNPANLKYSEPFSLKCNMAPPGKYKYQWLRNDVLISTNDTISYNSLTKELEGMYKCKATVEMGGGAMTLDAFTTVYGSQGFAGRSSTNQKPKIKFDLDNDLSTKPEMHFLSVNCKVTNIDPSTFTVRWIDSNGNEVSSNKLLYFKSLLKSDEGKYTCEINKDNTKFSKSFDLKIIDLALSIQTLDDESLTIGGRIKRKLAYAGEEFGYVVDTLTYKWTNDQGETVSNSNILDIVISDNSVAGTYTCKMTAQTSGKFYTSQTTVSIPDESKDSYNYNVDIEMKPETLKYSMPFSLNCKMTPSGDFKYQWLRDDVPISTKKSISYKSLTKDLEGMYKCKVTIKMGEEEMLLDAFTTVKGS